MHACPQNHAYTDTASHSHPSVKEEVLRLEAEIPPDVPMVARLSWSEAGAVLLEMTTLPRDVPWREECRRVLVRRVCVCVCDSTHVKTWRGTTGVSVALQAILMCDASGVVCLSRCGAYPTTTRNTKDNTSTTDKAHSEFPSPNAALSACMTNNNRAGASREKKTHISCHSQVKLDAGLELAVGGLSALGAIELVAHSTSKALDNLMHLQAQEEKDGLL